jgi:hypothetical protein
MKIKSAGSTLSVATISGQTSFAALVVDNSGVGDLLTASSSGRSRFTISQNGTIVLGSDQGTPVATTIRGGAATGTNIAGANLTFDASNGTGSGGSGDLIFRTASGSQATVAVDPNTSGFCEQDSGATNTCTFSQTINNNTNRLLTVQVSPLDATAVSSVTFNGQSLTKLDSSINGNAEADIWYLINPPATTANVVVTLAANKQFNAGAIAFYNVDQTTPFGTVFKSTGNSGTASTTVTDATVNDYVVDAVAVNFDSPITVTGTGEVEKWQGNSFFNTTTGNVTAGTGSSITMSSTFAAHVWAQIAVAVKAVSVASTSPDNLIDRLHITSNGNVGIGTTNPQATLDISSTGTIIGAGLSSDCSASNSKLLWSSSTKKFSCGTDRASVTIKKASNEIVNNSSVLQNDNDFTFSIGANETWAYQIYTAVDSTTTADAKFAVTAPSGATCRLDVNNLFSVFNDFSTTCGGSITLGHTGSVDEQYLLYGVVVNGANSGSVTLQWAQGTATAADTTMRANTQMIAFKLSGADLAEMYYSKDNSIQPGDIVMVDGSIKAGVQKTTRPYDSRTLGIISTNPGLVLGENTGENNKPVLLALNGRVPVKVSTENGDIEPGDYLTTSSKPGVAMKATKPGQMIGKALESYKETDPEKVGIILTFTNLSWADPTLQITDSGDLAYDNMKKNKTASPSPSITTISPSPATSNDTQKITNNITNLQNQLSSMSAELNLFKDTVTNFISSASLSASLSQTSGLNLQSSTNNATISGTLTILGHTLLSDVGITGKLTSGLLSINGLDDCDSESCASINTSSSPLRLQSHGLYGLDILDGKVTIGTNGNIKTVGTITAKEVITEKLHIKTNIATKSAVLATQSADLSNSGSNTSSSNASTGTIIIPAGKLEIDINTTALTPNSLIFATPNNPVSVGAKAKDTNTFTITLEKEQQKETKINWWIIN